MRLSYLGVLLLGLVILAGPGQGQPPRFPGGGGFGGGMLLNNEGVQKELKMSEEQVAKVKEVGQKVREKYKEDFEKLQKLEQQERREKGQEVFKKIADETKVALADVLKPEQAKRLKQIELQQRGIQALTDEEVQKTLKLTEDQQEKIKTISEDAGKDIRELFQNAKGNFQEAAKQMAELRKEAKDKAFAVLSEEQKKSWKEMTGDPFEVKFEFRRPSTKKE